MIGFTEKAEQIIQGAKAEARYLGSLFVDDIHILLSLLTNAAQDIAGFFPRDINDISYYAAVKTAVALKARESGHAILDDLPWTVSAQNVLKEAINFATMRNKEHCEPIDFLVGLVKSEQTRNFLSQLGFYCDQFLPLESSNREICRVHIRWMIRRDMGEVLQIEKECFEFPWSDDDFLRCLRQRNCIGMSADYRGRVVGFMIYELHKNRIHVLNFAVFPDYQRRSIGKQMVNKLVYKLSAQRRSLIILEVRETNLGAQLFFREMGFRVISCLHNYFEDTPEDAYLFEYNYKAQKPEERPLADIMAL